MSTKINVGGRDFTFTDLQDLKQQLDTELNNINSTLTGDDTKKKIEQLKEEEKQKIKELKAKYSKKLKALLKDTKELETYKKDIENYKKALGI